MPTRTSTHRYRRWFGLLGCIVLVAALAQIAGVGGKRGGATVRGTNVATVAGAPVPDVSSTKLATAKVAAKEGDTVQMLATAQLLADRLPAKAKSGVGVCGISFTRDGDASWTPGTPYESLDLKRGKTAKVKIDRSFEAPAKDTYRMELRCHVAAPGSGAKVRGNAGITAKLGLPKGAAKPI